MSDALVRHLLELLDVTLFPRAPTVCNYVSVPLAGELPQDSPHLLQMCILSVWQTVGAQSLYH